MWIAALFVVVLVLFAFTTLVWLFKLAAEIANALFFGVLGGIRLTVQLTWWCVRKCWRLVRWLVKRAAPAIGRALEEIAVWLCVAWLWSSFHARRIYVRRELKARKRK